MIFPQIYYKEPVFRPPSEANSLLIQATEGCTYKCTFCIGNEGKKFLIRPMELIKKDIKTAAKIYGDSVRKMFLLDGNAFVMSPDDLIEIAEYSYQELPTLSRIGSYAHAKDILSKSDEELKAISKSGIKIVYLGIETGDDELLKSINKRVSADDIAEAVQKLHKAEITLSGTIIIGLTGDNAQLGRQHAINTAKLINRLKPTPAVPWYISALTLMIAPGTVVYNQTKSGDFRPASSQNILQEFKVFFENLDDDLEKCIFRSNHASNYLPLESNNLARNKNQLIETINMAINHPESLRSEFSRGL